MHDMSIYRSHFCAYSSQYVHVSRHYVGRLGFLSLSHTHSNTHALLAEIEVRADVWGIFDYKGYRVKTDALCGRRFSRWNTVLIEWNLVYPKPQTAKLVSKFNLKPWVKKKHKNILRLPDR